MIGHNPTYTTSFYALPQEQIARIWQERAPKTAQMETAEEPGEQMSLMLVRLGDELYGLEMQYVSGIRPAGALANTASAPEWVLGVIHLLGRSLPVIDLRRCLKLPPAAQPGPAAFITVKTPAQEVIFCVDEVCGAAALPLGDLPASGMRLPERCAALVERRADPGEQPYIAVIDIPALLADPLLSLREDMQ